MAVKRLVAVGSGLILAFAALGFWFVSHRRLSVVRIDRPSARLLNAVAQARKGLPNFLKELRMAPSGDRFAVKCKFRSQFGSEYLWVRDPALKGSTIEGILDQRPIAVPNLKKGDQVERPLNAVYDWLIVRPNGSTTGEYTEKALSQP